MSKFSHIFLSKLDISCGDSERGFWSINWDPSKKEALCDFKQLRETFP